VTTIFSPAQLKTLIDTVVIPETDTTHKIIVVGTVDEAGAQVVAVFHRDEKTGFDWQLAVAARHTWTGDNQVGGSVIFKL
jgi:hypothetical protein